MNKKEEVYSYVYNTYGCIPGDFRRRLYHKRYKRRLIPKGYRLQNVAYILFANYFFHIIVVKEGNYYLKGVI